MFSTKFLKNSLKYKRFVNFPLIRMRSDLKEVTHTGQVIYIIYMYYMLILILHIYIHMYMDTIYTGMGRG